MLLSKRASATLWLGCLLANCLLLGCRQQDEVRTYVVPAERSTAAAPDQAQPSKPVDRGEPTDRMIGAILPTENRAWFFKAVGSVEDLASVETALLEFYKSIEVAEDQPTWSTPSEWSEREASGMRLATITIPVPEAEPAREIELSVIGLPLVGDWPTQVLDNANRWRKQLGVAAVTLNDLEETVTKLEKIEQGYLFDQTGWFEAGSMAPFARSGGASPPAEAPTTPPTPPAQDSFRHDPPEGWSERAGSAMRKASLTTPAGAEVTAFVFGANPDMADPLGNVNRWRGEIGLSATTAEALDAESSIIDIDGVEATYVELVGETETTLAVLAVRGPAVWFFKLRGPNEAAEQDREAFRTWLDSVELP